MHNMQPCAKLPSFAVADMQTLATPIKGITALVSMCACAGQTTASYNETKYYKVLQSTTDR